MCLDVEIRLTIIILLSIFAVCLASENCFDNFEIKSENLNKRLVRYTLVEKTVGSHHDCVRECFHFGRECKAINFNIKNKTCELKARGTSDIVDASEFEQAAGFIFTDITEWPKTSLSACVNHNCLEGQECFPLGNLAYKCVDKPNCGSPPVIEHGIVSAPVTTDGAIVTYSCVVGYEMTTSFSTKKCEGGSWTSGTIQCRAIAHIGCYVDGYAYLYHGTHQYTWNDILCQRWDSQTPNEHDITIESMQYGDSLSDSENYCRDPDQGGAPWCYTTDPSFRWEFCGIVKCL